MGSEEHLPSRVLFLEWVPYGVPLPVSLAGIPSPAIEMSKGVSTPVSTPTQDWDGLTSLITEYNPRNKMHSECYSLAP